MKYAAFLPVTRGDPFMLPPKATPPPRALDLPDTVPDIPPPSQAPELSLPWTGSKTTSMLQVSLLKKSHTKHWDLSVPIDMALKVKLLENMV